FLTLNLQGPSPSNHEHDKISIPGVRWVGGYKILCQNKSYSQFKDNLCEQSSPIWGGFNDIKFRKTVQNTQLEFEFGQEY
ncbi:MAG: hypothetical protein WD555_01605, partial [Fulvivirga sp.]